MNNLNLVLHGTSLISTSSSFVSFLLHDIKYLIASVISGPPITTIPNGGNEVEEVRKVDEKVWFDFGNVVSSSVIKWTHIVCVIATMFYLLRRM